MIVGCLFVGVAARSEGATLVVLLDVSVNGFSLGKIGQFTLRDGVLFSKRQEWEDLGFKVAASAVGGPDGLISIKDMPGLASRLDSAAQTIDITAPIDRLIANRLQVGGPPGPKVGVESGTGATLNYDVTGTSSGDQHVATGLLDMRVFSPWGIVSSGSLSYAGGGPNGPGTTANIRLDSTYSYSDVDALRQYRLGDFITGGLGWTRPVRLGGIQISSNFSLQPDLVTFPLPSVSGSAAVPSTVDLLVNGNQLLSRQIQAGPFQIPQLPVVTGAGTLSMTVTNALGQQTVVSLPFYASDALLSPGLQTYSAQAGAIRRNYGVASNDYGDLAASGTYRRGLLPWLTVEGSAEGTAGTVAAGAGIIVNLGNFAVLNVAGAGSTGSGRQGGGILGQTGPNPAVIGNGRSGWQSSIGVQRIGRVFSFGATANFASHNYRDIAAMNGDPVPRLQLNVSGGLSLGRYGSLGVAYVRSDRDSAPDPFQVYVPPGTVLSQDSTTAGGISYFQPAQKAHVLSLSYSVQIWKFSLYATGFRDSAPQGTSGVLVGLTIPLGERSSAGVSVGSGSSWPYEQVQAQQSPVTIGDWGYQALGANADQSTHEFGELQYKSPWGLVSAGADRINTNTTAQAEVQGAVSFVDGGWFPSNSINDSFAVVDTNGLKNVEVLDENRDVGRTDSAGRLIVPDLRSFDLNHIAIDPSDVPLDASIDVTTREVRPQDRSGVVVRFPVHFNHGALVRLVDGAGIAIPVGSTATLQPNGESVPVGYDGDAYVVDLAPLNRLRVEQPQGARCTVSFAYRPVAGQIPTIGPLRCR
jgi:outer membrane usher protein